MKTIAQQDFMIVCPSCGGKKTVFAFMNTGEDWRKHRQGEIDCLTCKGAGLITTEHAARINAGRLIYDERVARGETLRDAATRQGMTPAELSAVEHGRLPSNAKVSRAQTPTEEADHD